MLLEVLRNIEKAERKMRETAVSHYLPAFNILKNKKR